MQRLHAIIHGKVQGVSFRYYTAHRARELGVKGWVRNLPDDSVETIAEAEQPVLEQFLAFLHRGSPDAKVSRVDATWLTATHEFKDFNITG